jgi:hypothetical protein
MLANVLQGALRHGDSTTSASLRNVAPARLQGDRAAFV